jgi:hypothetical protein
VGFRQRAVAVLAAAAGVLSLAFTVLAAWAAALARYLPMWWSGWGLPEQSGKVGSTD